MLQWLQKQFGAVCTEVVHVCHPPKHIRLTAVGDTIDACLRKLEGAADLSPGDLSIDEGKGIRLRAWPTGLRSTRYPINSQLSEQWQHDVTKVGYITGSLYVPDEGCHIVFGSDTCYATLHISQNCPGVYRDNVCTSCGDVESY